MRPLKLSLIVFTYLCLFTGAVSAVIERIEMLIKVPEEGEIYEGKVVKIADFGAFVNILPGKDGLVHHHMKTGCVAHKNDSHVLDFIQKAFGGQIYEHGQSKNVLAWRRSLGAANRSFALRFPTMCLIRRGNTISMWARFCTSHL